jgi:hypothetical protein
MQRKGWWIAVRYGVPFGVGAVFVGSLNGVLQAYRQAIGPSAHGFVIFSYLWLLITIICILLAGQMSARASGSLRVGVWAGAIASALSTTIVFFIFVFSPALHNQETSQSGRTLPLAVNVLLLVVILLFFSVIGGGLFGALVALPGAWLGRRQARVERQNTPMVPEHFADQHEPLPNALDDIALPADVSSPDLTISPSWLKSMLMFLLALMFVAIGLAMTRSSDSVIVGWICVGFAGLLTPLAPINMAINRPLLRFTPDGIAYKGAYYYWRRGFVPWNEVGAIALTPASNKLFGRKELNLFIDGVRPWRANFQNWQLPSSVKQSLRIAMVQYRRQIEENGIVVQGIE